MTFNVPIRTLCIDKKSGEGEIGLGSGIVWDSIAEEEYEETKQKHVFYLNQINILRSLNQCWLRIKKYFY